MFLRHAPDNFRSFHQPIVGELEFAPDRYARGVTGLSEWLGRIGEDPNDDLETRKRKGLLVSVAVLVLPIGLMWGALYLALGAAAGVVAYARKTMSPMIVCRIALARPSPASGVAPR